MIAGSCPPLSLNDAASQDLRHGVVELALMRSAGFRRGRLGQMAMSENVVLLLARLLTGILAAIFFVLPHWLAGGAAIPWDELAIYLGVILMVGIISGLAAVIATLRAPLLGALRGS